LYEFLFRLNEKLCFSSWFGAVRFSFSSVVLDLINSTAPLFNLSCADFTGSFQLPSLEHSFFFFFHLTLGKQVLISGSGSVRPGRRLSCPGSRSCGDQVFRSIFLVSAQDFHRPAA
jgi:hypothetical protein